VFGPINYRNEINWQRSTPHGTAKRKFGVACDCILFYVRSDEATWHEQRGEYRPEYIAKYYSQHDADGRVFQPTSLLGHRGVNPQYEWRGIVRPWRYPLHRLEELDAAGQIYWPSGGGIPRFKRYLDEQKGQPILSLWTDIPPVNSQAAERLGYPTQKPEALLERIILASSNVGDVVLDPFCGCGTTIAAAEKLGRKWLGIDVTHLAITLMKSRLAKAYGESVEYDVVGEPTSVSGAAELAHQDRHQFQLWALGLVKARPIEVKKGADQGVDGRIPFNQGAVKGKDQYTHAVIQVKSGHVNSATIRDLVGTVNREDAALGVLITLEPPTQPMRDEAASAGFYVLPYDETKKYPRIQILTIKDLVEDHRQIECAPLHYTSRSYAQGAKVARERRDAALDFAEPDAEE